MSDAVWVFALSGAALANAAMFVNGLAKGKPDWLVAINGTMAIVCAAAAIMWSSL